MDTSRHTHKHKSEDEEAFVVDPAGQFGGEARPSQPIGEGVKVMDVGESEGEQRQPLQRQDSVEHSGQQQLLRQTSVEHGGQSSAHTHPIEPLTHVAHAPLSFASDAGWQGLDIEPQPRTARSDSTISNASHATSTTSSGRVKAGAGVRNSSGTRSGGADAGDVPPHAVGHDLLDLSAPAGNDNGFGFRSFPGHPHTPRTPGSAKFNTTNVGYAPGADLTPDGSSDDEIGGESDRDVSQTRAAMIGNARPQVAQRDADQISSDAALPAGVRVELGAVGAVNEQRAGEGDWAIAGHNTEFIAWKSTSSTGTPPASATTSTASPGTRSLLHHQLSMPLSPRHSGSGGSGGSVGSMSTGSTSGPRGSGVSSSDSGVNPFASSVLWRERSQEAGPEDSVVSSDGASSSVTVPVDHSARMHAVSPDAMRHEQMRGVLGQEGAYQTVHFYAGGADGGSVQVSGGWSEQEEGATVRHVVGMNEVLTLETMGGAVKHAHVPASDPGKLAMGQ